jgi:lactobin A/cerein 7B family class IIb bacteriocin
MNAHAFDVQELSLAEASEINGGEITAIMVSWGVALATAFTAGFAAGYKAAQS